MKCSFSSRLLTVVLGVWLVPAVVAQESIDVEFTVVSRYIWRGADLGQAYDPAGGDNHVHVQPSVTYTDPSGFSLGAWGSMGFDGHSDFDEIDLTVDYSFTVAAGLDGSVGHIYYDFPTGNSNSGEFYAGVSATKSALSPSLFVYYDYDDGDGWYVELALGHDFSLPGSTRTLSAGLTVGYNGGQWKSAGWKSGLSNIALSLSTEYPVRGGWAFSPTVTYVMTPGDRVNTENELVVGLGLSKSL